MSLSQQDLLQIRQVIEDVFDRKIEPIVGELTALRNDIKEICNMIARLERHPVRLDPKFTRLLVKEQILQLNAALVALAKKRRRYPVALALFFAGTMLYNLSIN